MPMHMNAPLPDLEGATEWVNAEPLAADDCAGQPVLSHWWAISTTRTVRHSEEQSDEESRVITQ